MTLRTYDAQEAVMDKVVHFEVPFDDGERATAFYREAFGWQLNSMPQMQYTLVTTTPTDDRGNLAEAGGINGGMLHRQGPITAPVITIGVDDIDESLARIEKLGGRVAIGRQPVGDMGFSAYVHDTEGNLIGLWENAG
jgi:predicted enzyme related to lactoylglutathione lyase